MLFIIILILSLIAGFITPWWAAAIIAFVAALFAGKKPGQAFCSGFAAVFIVWAVLILFKTMPNKHILAARVATLSHLPHWTVLLVITALIGGIVGGMSALSGVMVKRLFSKT
jgi:hypothetical protein